MLPQLRAKNSNDLSRQVEETAASSKLSRAPKASKLEASKSPNSIRQKSRTSYQSTPDPHPSPPRHVSASQQKVKRTNEFQQHSEMELFSKKRLCSNGMLSLSLADFCRNHLCSSTATCCHVGKNMGKRPSDGAQIRIHLDSPTPSVAGGHFSPKSHRLNAPPMLIPISTFESRVIIQRFTRSHGAMGQNTIAWRSKSLSVGFPHNRQRADRRSRAAAQGRRENRGIGYENVG